MPPEPSDPRSQLIRDHRRQWRDCLYVYPVISRRAKGLSVGVNLNPDKSCTFGCLYCQVDRRVSRGLCEVDIPTMRREIELALREAASGRLWQEPRFAATAPALRRINDVAFSGDGEPTCLGDFDRAVAAAAEVKDALGLDDVKLVVITNASRLDSPQFQRALPLLDAHHGEIWAKLDAGTDAYFQRLNRPDPKLALADIVRGITAVARGRPIVIQTLCCKLAGRPPSAQEIQAYCGQLRRILEAGGHIKLVQIHTIARSPADASASTLPDAELDAIARAVRASIAPIPVETYPGADVPPQGPSPQEA
jgi:wyosine [tRNA(Phe)-imidazoG37] synthetase (radical SAM superfamily)